MLLPCTLALASLAAPQQPSSPASIQRISFGSCIRQDEPQPIWDAVIAAEPEVFVLLGDNIYGDSEDPEVLRRKWAQLAAQPGYQALRASSRVLATWDDHDYGLNDAGAEYTARVQSQQAFLDFLGVPEASPRRGRAGIHHSEVFGEPGRRVQVILLDTRYHRSRLDRQPERLAGRGPYAPSNDPDRTMLGAEQWRWLRAQLEQPAELRIIASSVQFVASEHGWETWGNMPLERARLLELIGSTGASGVVLLSGDRHAAEISRLDPVRDGRGPGYPLYDVTSSAMNQSRRWAFEANPFREGDLYTGPNFGTITIDWGRDDPLVSLGIHDQRGEPVLVSEVPLSALQAAAPREPDSHERVERIAFGSCNQQDRPTPLWDAVRAADPDLFLFLGDNIYGDTTDMTLLRERYAKLAQQPGYAALREEVPVLATWDDHDFGANDVGREYPKREESREIFFDFFREPEDSPRREHSGVYGSWLYGPETERVQVILLDLRYNRSPWKRREVGPRPGHGRPGSYAATLDPEATILGEQQWRWLEQELEVPARLRVIGSSLQVLSDGHQWECWEMMPRELERLFGVIERSSACGVVFVSGDTHWGELTRVEPFESGIPYPLYELTSSGLNQAWRFTNIKNTRRLGTPLWKPNFGLLSIDWEAGALTLEAISQGGERVKARIRLEDLQP